MKIKTISYKRTNNLGNYSSESKEMLAELEDGDDPIECALKLKETVLISLGLIKPEKPQNNDLSEPPF